MTGSKTSVASIVWQVQVGSFQSRSSIVLDGGEVYVGTCGDEWNVRDRLDGVHCLSWETGKERWFTPTLADVNEIAVAGADLIVPTDSGDVLVLDREDGGIRRILNAGSAVLGRPIVYRSFGSWSALFASIDGSVFWLEGGANELKCLGKVEGGLRASLVPLGNDAFLAAAENGGLYKGEMKSGELLSHSVIDLPTTGFGASPSISASPLVTGNLAFVGYARDTYYDSPAVACIDHQREEIVWIAPAGESSFGNVRSTPALVDGLLVVASSYSDSVQLLDPKSGIIVAEVLLGQSVYQQWSAPVPLGPHHVGLGRVDGVYSIIDVRARRLVASISLATAATERLTSVGRHTHSNGTFALYPGEAAPSGAICATPAYDGRRLIVGTTDGRLTAVDVRVNSDITSL